MEKTAENKKFFSRPVGAVVRKVGAEDALRDLPFINESWSSHLLLGPASKMGKDIQRVEPSPSPKGRAPPDLDIAQL
ncbi:MAG: hypothetical protein APU95_02535 [Hadesarchaea archaeon YNP_N21]|nr:MAG: hypothetical protein APU95_02535 [Hadesarchaea archaeon YNP_N21]